jgi:hypothetical protein
MTAYTLGGELPIYKRRHRTKCSTTSTNAINECVILKDIFILGGIFEMFFPEWDDRFFSFGIFFCAPF